MKPLISLNSEQKKIGIILLVFGLFYSALSIVNHYFFRTTAWDLGIFNNALYDYAHLKWNISMVRIGSGPDMFAKNLLADHFELYPIIFSPFYYLFGSYTLLILQIAAILWGGVGAYKYVHSITNDARFSRLALIHFLSIWGIYSALAFDFHNNVVAAMGVSWFLYFFENGKYKKATLTFIFICIGKENMPLWMGFIGLALALWNFKNKPKFFAGFSYCISGFLLFVFIIKIAIPFFAPAGGSYAYNTYKSLGNNYGEVAINTLLHPIHTFSLLFINHLHHPYGNGLKLATHLAVIISGGWALFYRPKFLLMLIPIYGQKLFYDEITRWGIYCQYSIEWVPVLTIALFTALYSIFQHRGKWLYYSAIISVIITAAFSFNSMEKSYPRAPHAFYSAKHFKRRFNVSEVYKALELIPANASVSAHSQLVPHLSFRDTIYQYPYGVDECKYLALVHPFEPPFEFTKRGFDSTINIIKSTKNFEVVCDKNFIFIAKRK
ncbi:MAG: DUF2079 domain-containing protein [Bacteroidetes bacterium]|nr:DUF2079 domain-containing protein [Bacteroidota bacterium]